MLYLFVTTHVNRLVFANVHFEALRCPLLVGPRGIGVKLIVVDHVVYFCILLLVHSLGEVVILAAHYFVN